MLVILDAKLTNNIKPLETMKKKTIQKHDTTYLSKA
jgi:hypothetical protein